MSASEHEEQRSSAVQADDREVAIEVDASAEAASRETVRKTGRGFLVITAAKLYFMVTGALVQLGLPILFGSPEQFGVFKIVTEAIGLINMVVITGTMQAVSKLVSEQPEQARRVVNLSLRLQLALGLPIMLVYALLSPWIAARGFNDPTLSGLMQLSSVIIGAYAFYAIFVGYLNGVKSFVRQATLDITFQTLKTVGILGLVVLGFGVTGAVSGFVGAAALIMVIAGLWVWRIMRATPEAPTSDASLGAQLGRLARFLLLVMLYTFALNGLMRADLFLIKSIAGVAPDAMAGAAPVFKQVSDKFAGIYGAALNLARLPFQGVIAVTFVIFPLISEATFQQDREKTRAYIRTTFRYCLLLIGAVALPLIFNSDSVIGALYAVDYQAASAALAIMSAGIIAFALLYVAATIMIGAGHPLAAAVLMGLCLAATLGLNGLMLQPVHAQTLLSLSWLEPAPALGLDAASQVASALARARADAALAGPYLLAAPRYMIAAATATAMGMTFGLSMALVWLWRTYRAGLPWLTVARLGVAALVCWGVDLIFPLPLAWVAERGKIFFLGMVAVKMAVMGVAMLAALAVTREFNAQDLARVRAVLGRRDKKAKD